MNDESVRTKSTGRPPLRDSQRLLRSTLYLRIDQRQMLIDEATRQGKNYHELLRDVIDYYFRR